jgi:glyoxylase-like metal-dependent hydrolase (beta-lactamase superfamily II)
MIEIITLVFNPFCENTYVVSDHTGESIIIDPGCENAKEQYELKSELDKYRLNPVKLINTHCHIDHILGNAFIKNAFSIPLLMHKLDLPLLAGCAEQGAFFGLETGKPVEPDVFIEEGDLITFGKSEFEVLHIPGHSPGGITLVNRLEKIAIVGDVLFQGSIGRTDLPGGNFDLLIKNIKEKLLTLDPDTIIYPGHGPSTTVAAERSNNPFLI